MFGLCQLRRKSWKSIVEPPSLWGSPRLPRYCSAPRPTQRPDWRKSSVYKTPKDVAAFDQYYVSTHAPLAKKMPGLRSYEVSSGPVGLPVDAGGVQLVAILEFDSADAIRAALGTPEGKAVAADLANFADGGVDLMIFDSKPA
jgi:uncharacterized protein (TIGR02118 family)